MCARFRNITDVELRLTGSEDRSAGSQDVHRMGCWRKCLECNAHRRGQPALLLQACLVGGKFDAIRQPAVDQQVGDLLEFRDIGELENVIAAVVQIVAGTAHRADSGVPRDGAGQRNRFLRFRSVGHCSSENKVSSFRSYS